MMAGDSKPNGSSRPLQEDRKRPGRRRSFPRRLFKMHVESARNFERVRRIRLTAVRSRSQPPRLAWRLEVCLQVIAAGVILVSVGVIGGSIHRQLWEAAQLSDYRSTMREVCEVVRIMRWRAASGRRKLELRIDAPHRSFQLMTFDGQSRIVERTLWLSDGLEVLQAPDRLTADKTGRLSAASIVILAPLHNRLFRVTTTARGFVQCDEESSL